MVVETGKGKLPVRYGWNALAKFGDLAGLTMDEILVLDLTNITMSNLTRFIYVGFAEGARREGEECVFKSPEEVGELIDDEPDVITKVMDAFAASKGKPTEVDDEEGKKK